MRNPELLARRNQAIDRTFNEQFKQLKADPTNCLVETSIIYTMAVSRTAARHYLSIATIKRIIKRSPEAVPA